MKIRSTKNVHMLIGRGQKLELTKGATKEVADSIGRQLIKEGLAVEISIKDPYVIKRKDKR